MKMKDLTTDFLKETYLYKIPIEFDNERLSDSSLKFFLSAAVSTTEMILNIDIKQKSYDNEMYDFRWEEWIQGFGYLQLNHRPVCEIRELKLDIITGEVVIPPEWIKLKKKNAQINLLPYFGTFISGQIQGQALMYAPMMNSFSYIPQILNCSYMAGYAPNDEIPDALADYICQEACISVLNVLGEIAVGGQAALAGYSVSVDGLSQSVNTTLSAENHAFSARCKAYKLQQQTLLPALKSFYYGLRLTAF